MAVAWTPRPSEYTAKVQARSAPPDGRGVHPAARCASNVFALLLEFVAFLASHFQVEHQVLDVEAQLRERFLDQAQNSAAAADGIDHALVGQLKVCPNRIGCVGNTIS
ncbi:MAG: hypothetical protein NTZ32_09495 [Planctomycetales bacterium]|nr:hypothetical protein [Planctomycetales bacterium]